MRMLAVALIITALAGCAQQPIIRTVTIIKTVPVYPPDSLFDAAGCLHARRPNGDTVLDLAQTLAQERFQLALCQKDRAALRTWEAANKKPTLSDAAAIN